MNAEKCKEWEQERRNPSPKNPLTNRKIKVDGPKYKELDKDCQDLIVDINSICTKWLKDNHNALYAQIGKKRPSVPVQSPSPPPKVKAPKPPPVSNQSLSPPPKVKAPKPPPVAIQSPNTVPPPVPMSSGSDNVQHFYTIEERKDLGETIKDYFTTVIIEDGKACMTQTKTLLKYVNNHKLLGYGTFGNVYGIRIPTNPPLTAAVKEGRISVSEFKKALVKQYPMEYLYNKLINDLIDEKVCPNFTYTYAIFFCDKCTLNEFDKKPIKTQCSETITEIFNYTLDKLKDLRDEVMLSILFQILFAIASIQIKYGMFHNDVKKENILLRVVSSGGYWEYNLNGQKYYVPNYGYIAALNDFGVSLAFKPSVGGKNYGQRQAEVVLNPKTNEYYFKPFNTQFFPEMGKSGRPTKVSPVVFSLGQTWNSFRKNFDSKPSIPVDLEDMERFPAINFNFDIIDVVHMIIGGKRISQPGDHASMKVSQNIHNLFKDFYMVKFRMIWPIDRVDLFLANFTIKKLFSFYLNTRLPGPKIESYYL